MKGFVLLELLFATVIGSLLMMGMVGSLYQAERVRGTVERLTDVHYKATRVIESMRRDVMGIFIPAQSNPSIKPLRVESKDGFLSKLSCTSTSALQAYWSDRAGRAQPRVVRVAYTLEPDESKQGTYFLTRTETNTLAEQSEKKSKEAYERSYVIASGIKQMQVICGYYDHPDKVEKSEKKEEKAKKILTRTDWPLPSGGEKQINKVAAPLLPACVMVRFELWASDEKRFYPFTIDIPIMVEEATAEETKSAALTLPPSKAADTAGAPKQSSPVQSVGRQKFASAEAAVPSSLEKVIAKMMGGGNE